MTTNRIAGKIGFFSPISIFSFHGAPCCPTMDWQKDLNFLLEAPNCFLSHKIEEANVCLVFGSIARPLAKLIAISIQRMPQKRAIVHFLGCSKSPQNHFVLDEPYLTFNLCGLDEKARTQCVEGINACLKV